MCVFSKSFISMGMFHFFFPCYFFSDMSVSNLQYLSSEQALADLAAFIVDLKNNVDPTAKVITFGGSYPGEWVKVLPLFSKTF